ncbi:MAG: hypothetical protein IJT16_08845 [Lachnospiraceae bacterium]|nr:hypothetical protein [Lachnospiraceae bacterium]
MGEKDVFNEALQNFSREFAYGGAIRHLVERGYDAKKIISEMKYPLSDQVIERMVEEVLKDRENRKK